MTTVKPNWVGFPVSTYGKTMAVKRNKNRADQTAVQSTAVSILFGTVPFIWEQIRKKKEIKNSEPS